MPIAIEENVPLAPKTTLELGGPARFFCVAKTEADLVEALGVARDARWPILVVGGGSNLVIGDAGFRGLAIDLAIEGVERRVVGDRVQMRVGAGESWDRFVDRCVGDDLAGIECLGGIPGRIGATPIQNVGAYGQEVGEVVTTVRTIDRDTFEVRERSAEECGFGYRWSIFKEPLATDARGSREIVVGVEIALRRGGAPKIAYAELEKALSGKPRDLATVHATVVSLRRDKSMVVDGNDENRRSAGSFFVNPIVGLDTADAVVGRAIAAGIVRAVSEVPRFPTSDGRVKFAAAWLIERAGFAKGTRRGAVGISSRHALALVHHGGGTTRALLEFADEIVAGVRNRFSVTLEREPVFVGA